MTLEPICHSQPSVRQRFQLAPKSWVGLCLVMGWEWGGREWKSWNKAGGGEIESFCSWLLSLPWSCAHQSPAHRELQSSRKPASLLRDPLGLIAVPMLALLVTLGEVPGLSESVLICKTDIRCQFVDLLLRLVKEEHACGPLAPGTQS